MNFFNSFNHLKSLNSWTVCVNCLYCLNREEHKGHLCSEKYGWLVMIMGLQVLWILGLLAEPIKSQYYTPYIYKEHALWWLSSTPRIKPKYYTKYGNFSASYCREIAQLYIKLHFIEQKLYHYYTLFITLYPFTYIDMFSSSSVSVKMFRIISHSV